MSGYHFQTADHDASIAVDHDADLRLVLVQVAAGSCVTVELPLYADEARGLLDALTEAIDAIDPERVRQPSPERLARIHERLPHFAADPEESA
jgi:hypothetical protein